MPRQALRLSLCNNFFDYIKQFFVRDREHLGRGPVSKRIGERDVQLIGVRLSRTVKGMLLGCQTEEAETKAFY